MVVPVPLNICRPVHVLAFAVLSERVLFEKVSDGSIVALVSAPVPLPERMPPSVVEPVPPKLTARVVVPATMPVAPVMRREF